MRRIILLVTALVVTFGVFANGPMTATAPSLASVFGHFDRSAIKETAVSSVVPSRAARPIAKPAEQPEPPAATTEPVYLQTELQMTEIETIDLGNRSEMVQPVREFDGTFDKDGWFTLSYGTSAVAPATSLAPTVKSGSKANSTVIFSSKIIEKPAILHREADRNRALPQGKSSIFEPVLAQLRVETADGRVPAMKPNSKVQMRTLAKQSNSATAHTIVFSETAEATAETGIDASSTTTHASDRQVFIQASFPAASEKPAVRQITAAVARSFQEAPTVLQVVPKMGSAAGHDKTSSAARFLEANSVRSIFTAEVSAPPARIMKTAPVSEIHDAQFSASPNVIDIVDLAVSPKAEKPLGSRVHSETSKGGVLAKTKTGIFTTRDVTASISHPLPAEPLSESPKADVKAENAEIHTAAKANSASTAVPEFELAKNDPNVWLSSYSTTSPEFTAASLERPKSVVSAPKRAAVVVTGMTTLNIAPMKRAADGGYCDSNFIGEPIRFSQTAQLTLEDLLLQIHNRFGINFLMGPNVGSLPINIKAGAIPWNVLLRSQLFISGVRAKCIDGTTIELVENKSLSGLQDGAEVKTRFVKLKFLQRTGGGTVDLANRSQGGQNGGQGGGCGGSQGGQGGGQTGGGGGQGGGQQGETAGQQSSTKFDKLIVEIEKILGIRSMTESSVGGGGGQGSAVQQGEVMRTNRFVTQIPGRNILAIRATDEEHALIDEIIVRADRPPFQVVIKALVYTANQDKLRDIGVQTTIFDRTGRDKGGIFGHTLGGGGTLFDFSTIIGTFDFNIQATALQQNGVISVKSRPFATVLDGLCTTLNVGRSIPIVIDSTLGGQGDVVFVDASNNLAVTPYVIDDDNGDPMAVTLELRLGANDVDTSVTARDIPAISQRSIQTQLLLGEDKTAILGGFTVDSDTSSVSKTPGLGDIPIIGELFKRRVKSSQINRLYFAISASVIPFGEVIRPVDVPGATTEPPSITPQMKERADKAEPKQVKGP